MNAICRGMFAALIIGLAASSGFGQGSSDHTQTVPFDNPGRPGILKVISGEGDVTITGYSGREVRIKAAGRKNKPLPPEEDPKARGLKRVAGSGFSVTTLREENAVIITRPMSDNMNLEIQVPANTALIIGGVRGKNAAGNGGGLVDTIVSSVGSALSIPGGPFQGMVTVENVAGEMELSTLDGDILLKNVSGAVAASCVDGDITAVFRTLPENRPMAFSTIDGDLDITLPDRTKAAITASTIDGGVYTDFEMTTTPGAVKKAENGSQNPIVGLTGSTVSGNINGGGISIQLSTIDGNIYIRKAK